LRSYLLSSERRRLSSCCIIFRRLVPRHAKSTLFPYTTLFRSITAFGACGVYDARMQDSTNHDCQWDAEKNDFLCHAVTISKTGRSEEHTSELQSRGHLVCRLLLEKKNQILYSYQIRTTLDKTF